MKQHIFLLMMIVLLFGADNVFGNSAPIVSNVTVSQRTDGSKKVDIRYNLYNLSDVDGDKCTVSVQVSSDGGSTWAVPATSFTGAVGSNISPGNNKLITWDCMKDLPGVFGSNYRVKVTADDNQDSYLLADYLFDGNTNDYSGNNRHASAYNNYQYVSGYTNQAIRIVGSGHLGLNGGYVLMPFIALNEYPNFTISLWVNHQGDTSWSGHGGAFIFFGNHNHQHVAIMYSGDFPNCSITFSVGTSSITVPYPSTFVNRWNNVTLVKKGGVFSAYINGNNIGSNSCSLGSMSQNAGIGVHWFDDGAANRFIGAIDEVKIYNRSLSETEIQYLFQNP